MSYGNELFVLEVQSEELPEHWTDMSEHRTLAAAVRGAEVLLAGTPGFRAPIPASRIRIRQFVIEATFTAAGRLKIAPLMEGVAMTPGPERDPEATQDLDATPERIEARRLADARFRRESRRITELLDRAAASIARADITLDAIAERQRARVPHLRLVTPDQP